MVQWCTSCPARSPARPPASHPQIQPAALPAPFWLAVRRKAPPPRPNYFLALQVSQSPSVVAAIGKVHAAVSKHSPHLKKACVEAASSHLTLVGGGGWVGGRVGGWAAGGEIRE